MIPRTLTRRDLLRTTGLLLATESISTRVARAAADKKPRPLRHVLSDETYSLRDLIDAGRLTLLTVAEFHKNELNIRGISLNDLYFRSWERGYLDQIRESIKANDRVVTCLIMEGNLATADEEARKRQIEQNIG